MMKNTLLAALLILALGQISHFGLPWWTLAIIAGITGWLLVLNAWQAFFAGLIGGSTLWFIAAWLQDNANNSALSAKVGQLFQGASSFQLLLLTGFLGGLIGALGALTGKFAKDLVARPSRRNYLQEKRRR